MPDVRIPPPTAELLERFRAVYEPKAGRPLTELELHDCYRNLLGFGLVALDVAQRLERERALSESLMSTKTSERYPDHARGHPDGTKPRE